MLGELLVNYLQSDSDVQDLLKLKTKQQQYIEV